jgi:hypothetical protein
VVVTVPVQTVPLSVKEDGTGLVPLQAPLKPIEVDAPVASAPFQLMLAAVTLAPDCAQVALQPWVTDCPAAGKSKPSVQPSTGAPRLVIETLAPKPPDHWLWTVYVTEHPLAAAAAVPGSAAAVKAAAATSPAAPVAARILRLVMGMSPDSWGESCPARVGYLTG